jgi:hypothetical protein
MTTCAECHFVYEELPIAEAPGAIRHAARQIREQLGALLTEADGVEALRTRPEPATWSALEYAGHVRDVLLYHRELVIQTLLEETPRSIMLHGEERACLERYDDEDPATTATEVTIAADLLARLLAGLDAHQWARRCLYSYPEASECDLAWLARQGAHEAIHHLHDIKTGLRLVRPIIAEIDVP